MENENLFSRQGLNEGKGKGKHALTFKVLAIVTIILLLLIPKYMIQSLITEREQTAMNAMEDVYDKWGGEQMVIGPTITGEHTEIIRKSVKGEIETIKREKKYRILPNTLSFNGDIKTERRHRGIYEIVTYKGPLEVKGTFSLSPEEREKMQQIASGGTFKISFCMSDLKGICDEVKINLGGKEYTLEPDGNGIGYRTSQLSARIPVIEDWIEDSDNNGSNRNSQLSASINTGDWINAQSIPFSMKLNLKGSQSLKFAPIGKNTTVHLTSDCQTPSFCGNFLPVDSSDSTVTKNGFDRNWSVSYLNRNYPQFYDEETATYNSEISESAFGVNLLVPVGHYQKSLRCVKYAVLFIVLTLAVFFFIEMIHKKNIHPVQYALVGLALTLFYSLLLSFSEHIGFTPAYIVSTLMTVSLLTIYTTAVLKIKKTAFYIGGALLLLYVYIFVLIQMESYALLAGSLGLFAILAFFMYLSQKIEWNGEKQLQ
jgi:Inner membrane protein involved in colicin E2 resistance